MAKDINLAPLKQWKNEQSEDGKECLKLIYIKKGALKNPSPNGTPRGGYVGVSNGRMERTLIIEEVGGFFGKKFKAKYNGRSLGSFKTKRKAWSAINAEYKLNPAKC